MPKLGYSEIILLIAIGQMTMLAFGALRKRAIPYAQWLTYTWVWVTALSLIFYYHPEFNMYLVLPAPFLFRSLLLTFFDKPIPRLYPLQLLPPFFTGIVGYMIPSVAGPVTAIYLTWEAYALVKTYLFYSRLKGIDTPGSGSKKVIWLKFFFLMMAGMILTIVLREIWPLATPQILFIFCVFALSTQSAWYFSGLGAHEPLKSEQKYGSSTLDQPEKYRIMNALDHQLTEKKYALEPDASLAGLAKKVFASPHQLSQVINETKGMSFFDLMAYHRVLEAKKLLRKEENKALKIEEIGEMVGYMSKSSFNTVFKKFTSLTPSQYRDRDVRHDDLERRNHTLIRTSHVTHGTFDQIQNSSIMVTNFFKVYLRSLARNRAFTFINVAGLVLGLASALMIATYLRYELSYDKFHDHADDIYRIAFMSGNPQTRTPHPLAQAMVAEFPEVEAAVTLTPLYGPGLTKQSMYIRNPEKDVMFREPDGYAADSTFFQVFDFELVVGNEDVALKEVGGLIITQSLAAKYFGDENPLGKMLQVDTEGHPLIITGVMKDAPANSHFHPQFIVSYVTLKYLDPGDQWFGWGDYGHFNYVRLTPGTDAIALENKIPLWLHAQGQISDNWYAGFKSGELRFALQPITDIHLKSHIRWELEANGNITYVYILFAAIAFITAIAAINFINLSTARAFERAKEVGVRRTLGADKAQVTALFLLENITTSLAALLLATGLSLITFDSFKQLTGKAFTYSDLLSPANLLLGLIMALLIGTLSGVFPAITVSRIKAGEILKGKFVTGTKSTGLRKGLIVVQFAVSAILVFGSIILISQVRFMEGLPLGYSDEQVLVVDLKSDEVKESVEALKNEIRKVPGVQDLGTVSNIPGTQFNQNGLYQVGNPDVNVDVSEIFTDFDGNKPLELDLVAGRWFDKSNGLDSLGRSYIINETAAKNLGLEDPIGTRLMWDDEDATVDGMVVGIVKDFHFQSMHVPIRPLLITINYNQLNYLLVKLEGANVQQAVSQIGNIYDTFDDKFGYEAYFLDEKNQQLYEAEKQALKVFNLFAAIALLLAAMGLVGLAYLMMVQRTKEMGVRKILGASVGNLLWQENFSFLKLIAIAFVLGLPVAYFTMNEWLTGFAYRVPIGLLPYAITITIILAIASLSVTLAVLKTVTVNPSHALRYE
ncbi:ABC transporter permease [Imperialibacter roseus]|uniref:ABC transporter permease n=1 Tax=Imperialibacter roseus TaxID=1324217 RepID=A0ABZ0ISL4_9BACT|nr:ABC transporter permease [Imperialibacter roseus]WOK07984.1 ABC transporter permease [Imperialibacter roseus]